MANRENEIRVLDNILESPRYIPTAEEYIVNLPESGYEARVRTGKINWSKDDEPPRISYGFKEVPESRLESYRREKAPFDKSVEGMITPEILGYGDRNHFVLTFNFEDEEFPVQKADNLAEGIVKDLDQYLHEIERIGDGLELLY